MFIFFFNLIFPLIQTSPYEEIMGFSSLVLQVLEGFHPKGWTSSVNWQLGERVGKIQGREVSRWRRLGKRLKEGQEKYGEHIFRE